MTDENTKVQVYRSRVDLKISFDDGIFATDTPEAARKMVDAWARHIEEEYPDHIFMNLETSVDVSDPVLVTDENDLWPDDDQLALPLPD